jgi:hypothetical protein
VNVQFGVYLAFVKLASLVCDTGDAVHHQHVRYWQLGITRAEHLTMAARQ